MRVALIASPFISVPPARYGGTELFIAQLAEGLQKLGLDVVVYANGESKLECEVRWLYEKSQWPIQGELYSDMRDINHVAWALADAWNEADVVHLNNAPGLVFSRFAGPQFVYTVHHAHHEALSEFYSHYESVNFVNISHFQQRLESMRRMRTIHHGVDLSQYEFQSTKQPYVAFLGRIAPMKGVHTAIEVAQKSGMPLKIGGEVQPMYRDYFEQRVKPHIDGKFIEYVGEVGLEGKNELLGNAAAMLFPIEWDEPFGLVMIESMATGTPVLAFPGGSVPEVVADGVSGFVCNSTEQMAERVKQLSHSFDPTSVREYVRANFSVERMVREYAELYGELTAGNARAAAALAELEDLTENPEEPRAIA